MVNRRLILVVLIVSIKIIHFLHEKEWFDHETLRAAELLDIQPDSSNSLPARIIDDHGHPRATIISSEELEELEKPIASAHTNEHPNHSWACQRCYNLPNGSQSGESAVVAHLRAK